MHGRARVVSPFDCTQRHRGRPTWTRRPSQLYRTHLYPFHVEMQWLQLGELEHKVCRNAMVTTR